MMHPAEGPEVTSVCSYCGVNGDRGIVVNVVKHAHNNDSALRCKSVPIG